MYIRVGSGRNVAGQTGQTVISQIKEARAIRGICVKAGLLLLMFPSLCMADMYTVTVNDHAGGGLGGATVKYASGGWHTAGTTAADGTLTFDIPDSSFSRITVTYNQGTVEKTAAQSLADNYTWVTDLVRFELRNHAGNLITEPIVGGAIEVGGDLDQGGSYWAHQGYTADKGFVDVELFSRPSAYKFRMTYNHNSQTVFPLISGPDTVAFQTGLLVLDYDGVVRCNQGGSWWTFEGPSMELFPGTYTMYFDDGRIASYDVVAGTAVPVPTGVLLSTIGIAFATSLLKRRRNGDDGSR